MHRFKLLPRQCKRPAIANTRRGEKKNGKEVRIGSYLKNDFHSIEERGYYSPGQRQLVSPQKATFRETYQRLNVEDFLLSLLAILLQNGHFVQQGEQENEAQNLRLATNVDIACCYPK